MNDPCNRLAFPCLSRKLFAYQNTNGLRMPAVVSLTEMWIRTLVQGKQIQCQMRRDHWAAACWVLSPELNSTAYPLPLASGLKAPVTTHHNQSPQTTTSFVERGEVGSCWSDDFILQFCHPVSEDTGEKGEVQTLSFPGFHVQLGSFSRGLTSLPFHVWSVKLWWGSNRSQLP